MAYTKTLRFIWLSYSTSLRLRTNKQNHCFKTKKGELTLTFSLHFKNIPVKTEYHHQNQLMALEGSL